MMGEGGCPSAPAFLFSPDRLWHSPDETLSASTALVMGEAGHGSGSWVVGVWGGWWPRPGLPMSPEPHTLWRWVQCAQPPRVARTPLEGRKRTLQRMDLPSLCQVRCRPPPARHPI